MGLRVQGRVPEQLGSRGPTYVHINPKSSMFTCLIHWGYTQVLFRGQKFLLLTTTTKSEKYSNKVAESSRGQMAESFELSDQEVWTLSFDQWFPIWVLEKSFWQVGGGWAGQV